MLIDTHAHLNFPDYDEDRSAVLERAVERGVTRIICIGTDLPSSRKALDLAEAHAGVYATVGIHPHDAKTADESSLTQLREWARHPKVVAIGETGLDFYHDFSPRDVQDRVFRAQIALARDVGRPLVIHDRDAHEAVVAALEEEEAWALGGVMHCFSGDYVLARKVIERGFYVGFTGTVTSPNARSTQSLVSALPLEACLLETDCPYLTPYPYRRQRKRWRNEPAFVRFVAEKIAELRGLSLAEVAVATTANAERLFRLASV
jgi:TatD DNase family protein